MSPTRAILIGIIAGVLVHIPRTLWTYFPEIVERSYLYLIGVVVAGILVYRAILFRHREEKNAPAESIVYRGVSDLLLHIHGPSSVHFHQKWGLRAIFSLLLSCFGGRVGVEGAAIESAQEFCVQTRSPSASWFEQQRRTGVASSLAAGLSAAFLAPFASIVMTMELRMGGHSMLTAISAVSAFLVSYMIPEFLPVETVKLTGAVWQLDWKQFFHLRTWLAVGATVLLCSGLALVTVKFISWGNATFDQIFNRRYEMRWAVGGLLLIAILFIYPQGQVPFEELFRLVADRKFESSELPLLLASVFLTSGIVIITFGTAGVFMPLLALGGIASYWMASHFGIPYSAIVLTLLIGAASLCSALVGTPFATSLLIAEWSGNWIAFLPCFIASYLTVWVIQSLSDRTILEKNLTDRGLVLERGRATSVLNSLQVKDVMVRDVTFVDESQSIRDLLEVLDNSHYPFLIVRTKNNRFCGLLTADRIHQGAEQLESLNELLEAKDLLSSRSKHSLTIGEDEKLTSTTGIFDNAPVVPVLDNDASPTGLLFAHHVRIAYDREVAKRSLEFKNRS